MSTTQPGPSPLVTSFVDSYHAAFERFNVAAITAHFAFPLHVTGEEAEISVVTVSTADAWQRQIARLADTYRAIGVKRANILDLVTTELSPRLYLALVGWALENGEGDRLYDFVAAYTLAHLQDALHIVAIAHNETPRLREAMSRVRPP